jgi:hypothetical protein
MLDARGQVRKDLYKPNGDVHLNSSGTKIASLRIRNMLEIMLPAIFPVQASVQAQIQAPVAVPVVVNPPPAINVPLVAAGVQQLVGQIQDLVVQNVTIVQPPVAMEVEGDNEILKRLFLQRFGRALPEQEPERNEVDDIVGNMDLIDLTKEDDDEMEVATPTVVVVKTESIETPEAPEAPSDDRRRSSRLERRSLRKSEAIPEKEAPLAAENVIADTDADMAEDASNVNTVNPVGPVNAVESLTSDEAFEMAEQAIAESDAAIAENQKVIDEFYNIK